MTEEHPELIDTEQRRYRWVRDTVLFGKRYSWYEEIETRKFVLRPLKASSDG